MGSIKNSFLLLLAGIALFPLSVNAQRVSEEAKRHMVRGQTAVELAKTPADLEGAMREFKAAIAAAPRWAQPHYELAQVQEKAGYLKDATASLRNYLRLYPKAPNAARIREHIYKLEYKAEQGLSITDIINVLTSGYSLSSEWENISRQPSGTGSATKRQGGCRTLWMELHFKHMGGNQVQVLESEMYYQPDRSRYQTIRLTGPAVKYVTSVNVCGASNRGCESVIQNEIEVVSRDRVNVRQTVLKGGEGAGVADDDVFTCTYQKVSRHK